MTSIFDRAAADISPRWSTSVPPLAGHDPRLHAHRMFVVSESDAAAIRTAFEQDGELSAAIELRRRSPGIAGNKQARAQARAIAGWKPRPVTPRPVTRLRPGRDR
jgi:hypothetical protein